MNRTPRCAYCRNHRYSPRFKDHKRTGCPYRQNEKHLEECDVCRELKNKSEAEKELKMVSIIPQGFQTFEGRRCDFCYRHGQFSQLIEGHKNECKYQTGGPCTPNCIICEKTLKRNEVNANNQANRRRNGASNPLFQPYKEKSVKHPRSIHTNSPHSPPYNKPDEELTSPTLDLQSFERTGNTFILIHGIPHIATPFTPQTYEKYRDVACQLHTNCAYMSSQYIYK